VKLAIGSVQFGVDYGAFNTSGQVSLAEVSSILKLAKDSGIDLIDTARGYGTAEKTLGNSGQVDSFRVVTKCPSLKDQPSSERALRNFFENSCSALGVSHVYGYMLHDANDLNGSQGKRIWDSMEDLRAEGRVERIGVSTYGIEEALALLRKFPLSLVQVPGNVLVPWYEEAQFPDSVEVHVRSVFLQGFLLNDPGSLGEAFKPWKKTLEDFHARAYSLGLTPLQAAIAPLLKSAEVDCVVVGIDSLIQLNEIIEAVSIAQETGECSLGLYPDVTSALTDPRNWN